jgi:hypothetical protein
MHGDSTGLATLGTVVSDAPVASGGPGLFKAKKARAPTKHEREVDRTERP